MMNNTTITKVFEEHNLTEQEIYMNLLNGDSATVIAVAEMADVHDDDIIEALTIFFMSKIMKKGKIFTVTELDKNIIKVISIMKERDYKFEINKFLGAFAITFPNKDTKFYNAEDVNMKTIFEFISKN